MSDARDTFAEQSLCTMNALLAEIIVEGLALGFDPRNVTLAITGALVVAGVKNANNSEDAAIFGTEIMRAIGIGCGGRGDGDLVISLMEKMGQ